MVPWWQVDTTYGKLGLRALCTQGDLVTSYYKKELLQYTQMNTDMHMHMHTHKHTHTHSLCLGWNKKMPCD